MKRFAALALVLSIGLFSIGCGAKKDTKKDTKKPGDKPAVTDTDKADTDAKAPAKKEEEKKPAA